MRKNVSAFVWAMTFAAGAVAQSGGGLGSISGIVQDASGATVPGAAVLVSNDDKGIHRSVETSSRGQFVAPALIPASGYKVTVSKAGFANYEVKDITLSVGQNFDLHILLGVATTTTTIEVSGQAALVEDTKTDLSQLVGQRQIQDLPINARRADSFVLLTPAVVPDGAFGLLSFRGVAGHNSFLTDGNDTTNHFYNDNPCHTPITTPISHEPLQQFHL